MLSQIKNVSSRFITSIFISGINEAFITKLISNHNMNINKDPKENKNNMIYPEILFYYPQDESGFSPSFLEYIFIDGINIQFNLQPPKFIPEVLTDAKGERTYLYSIRLFDKIEINHKNYYLPYALSIWSPVNDCEAFKNILTEFYRIMKSTNKDISNNSLINYHNLEFIHMIIFLTDIILPPYNTKMILNFHFSSIELIFPSLSEIPNNEEYIQLLFDCLEISAIIKLWCSVLCEKHIIFLANQGYLLFAITQGLLSLIFPFTWLYTYIPILPMSLIDYLDSPIPYIIGMLGNTVDINELNEKFPGHVICDLNSSTINKNGISFLSNIEEDIIKKKIRFLYNPNLFEVEDIYLDENEKQKYHNRNFELEDIDMTKTFGENIHYIFFRIFRYQLSVIQSNFVKNKVFDVQIFLEDFCQDEMRDFWDKLTSTEAFDHFLMNLNNNDNAPFSKIISKILSFEGNENENELNINNINNQNKKEEPFVITYTLPSNMNYIMNQFIEMEDRNDDYGKALQKLLKDYNNSLILINNELKFVQKLSSTITKNTQKNSKIRRQDKKLSIKVSKKSVKQNQTLDPLMMKRFKSKVELIELSDVSDVSKEKKSDDSQDKIKGRESLDIIIQQPAINLFYLYGLDTIRDIEQKIIKNQIRKLKMKPKKKDDKKNLNIDDNNDLLYHQDFLSFSKFFFVTLTLKKYTKLGYRNIFIKKIKSLLKNYSSKNIKQKSRKLTTLHEFDLNFQNGIIKKEDSNSLDESISGDKIIFESSSDYCSDKEDLNMIKTKSTGIGLKDSLLKSSMFDNLEYYEIINISNCNSSQFLLMAAFLLQFDTTSGFNNNIYTILKLYEKSYMMNELEFSYSDFSDFINLLDYVMLHRYYQDIIDSKEYDNLTMKKYINIIYQNLKQKEEQGKGIRRKVRIFRTVKLNNHSGDALIQELQKKGFPKNYNKLSNKNIFQYRNLMNFDKNYINVSLYHLLTMRKNSENEGNNPLKMNILNMYKKYKKTAKDPSQIVEEIGILMCLFILQKSLHKLQPEVITSKFLSTLNNSEEFKKIKDVVAELQVIDLKYLLNVKDNHKTSFWLNILNFLVIFAIIYRKENILTNYEWHKLKKNSYFNIGGFNFSLQEIEMNIIGNKNKSKTFYEEMTSFPRGDSRNKFKIDNPVKYVNFGIYEPMNFSFKLQIYFPQTIENQILKNAIDYCSSKIIFDGNNILVKIPEYILWVDDNFLKNLDFYKHIINADIFDFMNKNIDKVEFIKHDWSLNFSHSVT
jgi:hypothetical protein